MVWTYYTQDMINIIIFLFCSQSLMFMAIHYLSDHFSFVEWWCFRTRFLQSGSAFSTDGGEKVTYNVQKSDFAFFETTARLSKLTHLGKFVVGVHSRRRQKVKLGNLCRSRTVTAKKRIHEQSCCFANYNLLYYCFFDVLVAVAVVPSWTPLYKASERPASCHSLRHATSSINRLSTVSLTVFISCLKVVSIACKHTWMVFTNNSSQAGIRLFTIQ